MSYKQSQIVPQQVRSGFTLIEVLVVVAIIGILAVGGLSYSSQQRDAARLAAAQQMMIELANAAKLYHQITGEWPPDGMGRNWVNGSVTEETFQLTSTYIPPELEGRFLDRAKLGNNNPFNHGFLDWDVWDPDGDGQPIVQVSFRFCGPPTNEGGAGNNVCDFPETEQTSGFDENSDAIYYCLEGDCHPGGWMLPSDPDYADADGYCINSPDSSNTCSF